MTKTEIINLPTSSLAYLGDCVLELLVREKLILADIGGIGDINSKALTYVTAVAQSDAFERIEPLLNDDELGVYKRGRNNTHSAPKSATHAQYSRATGFECLFAYLHLMGNSDRIKELFAAAYPD
ncbi:MAG: ribonuclease III [Clostridia bacterium]|nr:ribonuclease III [Clostridia bacterium]